MKTIIVDQNSSINTIQKALDLVEMNFIELTTIYIKKGIYHEKLRINQPNLTLIGEDKDETIITYNDYAKKIHQDGKEYNTFRTYTVIILKPNITFKNLTIQNSAGYGDDIGQAVALSVYGDQFRMFNCNLLAHQDTLFNGPLPDDLVLRYDNFLLDDERLYSRVFRQYFHSCQIKGDVDFIFGCGNAVFEKCEIISLKRKNITEGFVCAPAHPHDSYYGHTFINCKFLNDNLDPNTIYLARPWRDFGKATFINCFYDNHIKDEGFDKWNDTLRDQTARFAETPNPFTFKRVKWAKVLDDITLTHYTIDLIFEGWNPNND